MGKIDAFQKLFSGSCFENCVVHVTDVAFRKIAFLGVYEIVGLNQDLVVRALNRAKRVVVRDQPDDALELFGGNVGTGKKLPRERRAFKLLIAAVGVSVFFAAQGAGNIMDDGGKLQRLKRIFWQALARADGGGVGVDLQKVVDVVLISVREEESSSSWLPRRSQKLLLTIRYPRAPAGSGTSRCNPWGARWSRAWCRRRGA